MLLNELAKSPPTTGMIAYHDTLSDKIWDGFELNKEVHTALKKIADTFIETLGVPPEAVVNIIITGSLCNYNYTKYSDIDLHVVLNYQNVCDGCEAFSIDDCMKAKKSLWNETHDITVYGLDVEVYAQDIKEKITGNAGVFSISNNAWLRKPTKEQDVDYDVRLINNKADYLKREIDTIIDEKVNNLPTIQKLKDKIKQMRKAALDKFGELSVENLVFKILRNSGYMEKLMDYAGNTQDEELSLK